MRFDRFATLYIAGPLSIRSRQSATCLPALMYHSVSNSLEERVSPYYRTVTQPQIFQEQMAILREAGWRGVTLSDGLKAMCGGAGPREKLVAITFDDGFEDFYTSAFPALRENGFSATMYLPTAYISENGKKFKQHRCLTWGQVQELNSNGIEFGSHTVTHPKLWEMDWSGIYSELTESKSAIEDKTGKSVFSFAYPYAFPQQDQNFCSKLREALQNAEYRNCATTIIGRIQSGADSYALKRLPANGCDDRQLLLAKLNGAYDWLGGPQSASKKLSGFIKPKPPARKGTFPSGSAAAAQSVPQ
jgi:peptidoglycan/xylan/chitin deacetylase (PgdA/CDA1 family)